MPFCPSSSINILEWVPEMPILCCRSLFRPFLVRRKWAGPGFIGTVHFRFKKCSFWASELLFSTQSLLCVLEKTSLWITRAKFWRPRNSNYGASNPRLRVKASSFTVNFVRQIDKVRTKHKSCQRHTFSEFYFFGGSFLGSPKPLIDRLFWGLSLEIDAGDQSLVLA